MKTINYNQEQVEDDFGWDDITAVNEPQDHQGEIKALNKEIEELLSRLSSVDKMISPLFDNLMKDPDKPMIKWPDRLPILKARLKEFKSLVSFKGST